MNYSDLSEALQDYLQTTETSFVANIPNFVRQAEERINRAVVVPELRKTATGTLTTDVATLARPADYISTLSLSVTGSEGDVFLLLKDETFIREAYPDSTDTGLPAYYAIMDDEDWLLAPTPDADYPYTLRYQYDPESIVTASTSWWGDNAETVLLYGSLVEAYTYLKGDPDLIQQYDNRYKDAVVGLADLGLVQLKRDDYRNKEQRGGER